MHTLQKGIDWYKWITLIVTIILGVALGWLILGPFLTSGVLEWAEKQEPIVRELISVESIIVDSLISSCVPMFLLWAVSFYAYSKFKGQLDVLNRAFPLTWLFAQSPATLILFLSSVLSGVCIYGWNSHESSSSLIALSILAGFFVAIGFVVRATCTPKLKKNEFLDKHSVVVGHICVALTLTAYLWGVLSDPIGLYMIVNDSMKNG
ncbi:hypothetical protein [Aquipseudomonas alcaligenes]|uniref:Uncharacterized protein n=1 Tax=Aquipseudomonas alcaligenes TaxID=43263 RepID=A0AB73HWM2_AQUAC|nr:hypothetical protein [Pseudomonas alcaligenes]MDH0142394.1 hypothetical protein [Pseudomonas alcaligenes]